MDCGNKLEKVIFCSQCDSKNQITSNFCFNCGNILKPSNLAFKDKYRNIKINNENKIDHQFVKLEYKTPKIAIPYLKLIEEKFDTVSKKNIDIKSFKKLDHTVKSFSKNSKNNTNESKRIINNRNEEVKDNKSQIRINGKNVTVMSLYRSNTEKNNFIKKNRIKTIKTINDTPKIHNEIESSKNISKFDSKDIITKKHLRTKFICEFCGKSFVIKYECEGNRFCSVKCKFRFYEGYEFVQLGLGYIKIAEGGNAFKIGYTNNPFYRHQSAQRSNHRRLFLVYQNWEKVPEVNFEQILTKKLKSYHRKNIRNEEWFDLNDESKKIIEKHCKINIIIFENNTYQPKLTIIEDLLPEKGINSYYGPTLYIFLTLGDPAVIIGSSKRHDEQFLSIKTDQHSKLFLIRSFEFETSKQAIYVGRKLKTHYKRYKYNEGGNSWFKPEILANLEDIDKLISEITLTYEM